MEIVMNKYINAEQLKKEFPHNNDWDYPVNTNSYVVELIDSTPYIDLVYCKDCIYRPLKEDPDDKSYGFNVIAPAAGRRCPCLIEDGWYSWMPPDDFYCAYGKRTKED